MAEIGLGRMSANMGRRFHPKGVGMILAGDIGATKTALALFEAIAGSPLRLARQATSVSRGYPPLEAILGESMPVPGPPVLDRACFGVAGPVESGIAHLTNLPWIVAVIAPGTGSARRCCSGRAAS